MCKANYNTLIMRIHLTAWILLMNYVEIKSYTCVTNVEETRIKCLNHSSIYRKNFPVGKWKNLKINEFNSKTFDIKKLLKFFPKLESISLENENISKIIYPDAENNIKELKLTRVGIKYIDHNFLSHFNKLESLDLEGNRIQSFPKDLSFAHLRNLILTDNHWNCSNDLDWIFQLNKTIAVDLENATCFGEPHAGKSLLTIANFMKNIQTGCPVTCECTLPKVVIQPETDHLEPIIEVNCSYRGFTEMPTRLPLKTKILKLEGNNIKDLTPLINNSLYKNVIDLYLDDNQVNSIDILEGSYWLKHFRVFSLSKNKLTEIPTYALDNALMQNVNMPNAVKITLGDNPWRCDCVFTPVFQEMLQKYASEIKDLNNVKCSYVEGDENSRRAIIELTRSSVCRMDSDYSVHALDLLNAILASLIVLILGKLAYDYYFYKKTGRLPWIVTKLP